MRATLAPDRHRDGRGMARAQPYAHLMTLETRLEAAARAADTAGFGIADAAPFPAVRGELERRKAGGSHGELTFTYNDPVRSTDVRVSIPWAQRLVVVAWSYVDAAGSPGPPVPGTGRVARFATEDHYRPLRAVLGDLSAILADAGWKSELLVDDNRLVDRAAAVRAGVGWWGKSSMVLVPGAGPWVLLGSVVTDATLTPTTPMRRDCGTCTACIPACPTGAIVAPGVLDARRCLARWAQAPGMIPLEFRRAMGDRLYGCDDCLDACPPGWRALGRARGESGRIDLRRVLESADDELLAEFGHFYLPRRRPDVLRRNALVALGNAPGPGAAATAAAYLTHESWMLRAHAAWALGEVGGDEAHVYLEAALGGEQDDRVRSEIEAALR